MTAETFNVEAFIDGYIECALWADCLPAQPPRVAELCQEIQEARRLGRDPQRQLCELASIEEESYSETGGCEHLSMRDSAREKLAEDCRAFIEANLDDLLAYCEERSTNPAQGPPESYAGHDFWLTRNGHETGYWDRGLGQLGDRLSQAAKVYGEAMAPHDCGDGTADV